MRVHATSAGACIALAAVWAGGTAAQIAPASNAKAGILTMQAAVDAAVSSHPSLRSARSRVRQAGESIDVARSNYYPQLDIGVNSQASNNRITGYDSQNVHRAQLSVSQLLYDFGQTGSKVDRAEASKQVSKTKVQKAYANVVRNTAGAWIQVRKYRELIKVAEDRLEAVRKLAGLAQKREAKGASTHSDTAQANARVEAARAELLRVRSQKQRWRTILMHWVGANVPPQVAGSPDTALATACRVPNRLKASWQAAPVRLARAKLMVARAAEDVASTKLRPTLSLNASVSRGLGANSRRIGEDEMDMAVTLNFSMPLFQGGRLRSKEDAAQYAVAAARAARQQARLAANRGLQSTIVQWRNYLSLRQVQQQRVESMRVTRKLYRRQYLQLGTRSLLDLLDAEREYYGALSDRIKSEYGISRLGIDCLYYTGQLHGTFETGIETGEPAGHTVLVPSSLRGLDLPG